MEGLIHGGAYFRNFTVFAKLIKDESIFPLVIIILLIPITVSRAPIDSRC